MGVALWILGSFLAALWPTHWCECSQPSAVARGAQRPVRIPVTPVLPPLKPGERAFCEQPPTDPEILHALSRLGRGVPYVYEEFRDDIEITKEKLIDRIDPPRFFPMIGPAQLHHCHWKCTVSYKEWIEVSYPIAFRFAVVRHEVIYIDKDQIHLCAGQPPVSAAAQPQRNPPLMARPDATVQVQVDVLVLKVFPSAVPVMRWPANTEGLRWRVLTDSAEAMKLVNTLRHLPTVKVLAEPRLVTLSGRTATFQTGGEVPELIRVGGVPGVASRPFGLNVELLPTAKGGKIDLQMRAQSSGLNSPERRATADMQVSSGQSVVLAGLPADDAKHELLILVTPRLVGSAPATASRLMTLDDVVSLAARRLSDDIIIRHMDLTESRFDLTVADLLRLADDGVSENVIRAMQQRHGRR